MITKSFNSLGFELNINIPGSVEEYDQLAKSLGACLESAVSNVVYRSVLAKFRSQFAESVENNTGIKRNTEVVKKADGSDKVDEDGNVVERYIETEKVYFDKVCASLVKDGSFASTEAAASSFLDTAQSIMDTIVFDPSEPEKQSSGPKKVSKKFIELATQAEAAGKLTVLADVLRNKLGDSWKIEDTVDSVARAVAEDQRRINEAKKLTTEYGI